MSRAHLKIRIATLMTTAALLLPLATQADAADAQAQFRDHMAAPIAHAVAGGAVSRSYADKRDHAALVEFYNARGNTPVWLEDGKLNARARQAIFFLSKADVWGLDPKAYVTPALSLGQDDIPSSSDLADAELSLSRAVLAYARHAQAGQIVPSSLNDSLTNAPTLPDPISVLEQMATTGDLSAALAAFNPPAPQFQALRQKLAELRQQAAGNDSIQIPAGRIIRPGMRDPRVSLIKKRLGIELPPALIADPNEVNTYGGDVVEAMRAFQQAHGLAPDGAVGPATLAQMNSTIGDKISTVLANMERWRWLPRDLGASHVFVDIPAYEVRVVANGKEIYQGRVVVGTARNQTPVFSDAFEYMEVNPYWNVPQSIAANEVIPAMLNDPDYLRHQNLEIVDGWNGHGDQPIDPESIDWRQVDPGNMPFRFRQPPGQGNALGYVKFMFPNKHQVYLHDTPARSLFSRAKRAYSHGCVRLHEPLKFADALLSLDPEWNARRVEREIARGDNHAIPLKYKIPVHLTYFTAVVDDAGNLALREDVYGHDRLVIRALGL